MKEAHLTLRLPAALASALARSAEQHGVPKSELAREAVARYLEPTGQQPDERLVRAGEVAKRWALLPRLSAAEADDFAAELRRAREALPPPSAAWE
jgi:predicted transcriptional regulator